MNDAQIRHLLTAIQVDLSKHSYSGSKDRTQWLNIKCPFAPWRHLHGEDRSPSFGITVSEERRSVYKCFSCQSKGRLSALPSQLGHLRKRNYEKHRKWAELAELRAATSRPLPAWEQENAVNDERADGKLTIASNVGLLSPTTTGYPLAIAVPYLRQRGISWPTTYLCDLRYDSFQKRILFPVYSRDENFAGFTGRSTRKGNSQTRGNDPKVRDYFGLSKRSVFLRLRYNERRGRRILVEGLFDYATLVQHGYRNTHAILGTAHTDEKIDILIEEGEPVFFLMDNDFAGWQAVFGTWDAENNASKKDGWADALFREIPTWVIPWRKVFDERDPGQLAAAEIKEMLSKAWLYTGKTPIVDRKPVWRPRVKNS